MTPWSQADAVERALSGAKLCSVCLAQRRRRWAMWIIKFRVDSEPIDFHAYRCTSCCRWLTLAGLGNIYFEHAESGETVLCGDLKTLERRLTIANAQARAARKRERRRAIIESRTVERVLSK